MKILQTRLVKFKPRVLLIIALIILIFLFNNFSTFIRGNSFVARPIMWFIVFMIIWGFPAVGFHSKLRIQYDLRWWTTCLAAAYIFVMLLSGVVQGFGLSPYSHTFSGVLMNLFYLSGNLLGLEYARSYLVNSMCKKDSFLKLMLISLFITSININFYTILDLNNNIDVIKYIGINLLPEVSISILACYLVYLGGPFLSIIYIGMIKAFEWFSPALPNLNWLTKSMLGTVTPIISLIILYSWFNKEGEGLHKRIKKEEKSLGFILTSITVVLILWFAVGVFPIKPYVIATGSMQPAIKPGDVVIVNKPDTGSLKVGDVIQFKRDNIYVFHRINKIINIKGNIEYQTKGDNNKLPDSDLVSANIIKGKMIFEIPKIGLPAIMLRNRNLNQK